jgi:dipeptidyl aminopeptidase/acylaminoacyl peptidase
VVVLGVLAASAGPAFAQGTAADYERAGRLAQLTRDKVFKSRVEPHWFDGNTKFWYRNDLAGGKRAFVLVDAVKGVRQAAFDHERLAAALSKATGKEVRPDRLSLDDLAFDGDTLRFSAAGKRWRCSLATYELAEAGKDTPAPTPGSLTAQDRVQPSRRDGPETSITFVNRRRDTVEVLWSDGTGALQSYGTVKGGEERRLHTFAGHVWAVTDAEGRTLAAFTATEAAGRAVLDDSLQPRRRTGAGRGPRRASAESPDRKWTAFVKDHNVWLRERDGGKETALSRDGTADDAYGSEFFWAPDSSRLVALRTRKGAEHKVTLVESSPRDQVQPRLHTLDYLKPGDQIPLTKPHLFDIAEHKEVPVADELFPNPWETRFLGWDRDSGRFTFLYNQRGHQVLRVLAVDAHTGKVTPVIDEQSKTFIDYAGKFFLRRLEETGEILWMSERDGWNHLYLYDARTGKVKSQVTHGDWVVRGVDRVDEAKRQVWFRAGGMDPEQDPYYIHYCRVNFDGTGLVRLTEGDGTHTVSYSPDGRFLVDTWSRVDLAPVSELRRVEDGKRVCELERADMSALLETGWRPPERFVSKGRDGHTDIYGVLFRPTRFDPARKYPVLEDIYAGPQGSFVPKEFRPFHRQQAMAELGFVVVQIDGMGTSNRSKAFHDVCWKNLADAGFPDRILWIKAAAAKYPYLDLARVGLYGVSAGAQSTLAGLLAHPDFYKAGVAACGCHDNRMDKIWWNELWMGWPVGPHYAEQSNVTNAHKLQGKLLLIVGELDRNVDPASTMQVVNALIKANKDFELLVVPGADHGLGGAYGARRQQDFFVRHLLGVEPRSRP